NVQSINGTYTVLINPASPDGVSPPILSVGSAGDPSETPARPPDALDLNLNAGVYKLFGNTPYAPTVSVTASAGNTTIVPPRASGSPPARRSPRPSTSGRTSWSAARRSS